MTARRAGFTLLEVMVAVAILAIALSAVFSAEAGAVRTAQRARKMSLATLLVRCKMGELEEDVAKKGLPAVFASGKDNCCKDAEIDGFKCKWEIQPIVLPDTMFGDDEDKDKKKPGSKLGSSDALANVAKGAAASGLGSASGQQSGGLSSLLGAAASLLGGKNDKDGLANAANATNSDGKDKDSTDSKHKDSDKKTPPSKDDAKDLLSGDPSRFLSGNGGGDVDAITAMAMQFVYPVLKPAFQGQIRRATVTVSWSEGNTDKDYEVTQYLVAEQPVPLATDPNNPNALLGAGTGTGMTTGTGTSVIGSSSSTNTWVTQ